MKRSVAWLCLILQILGGAWALGRMLCIGADGHVAIEVAHAGACEVESRRHHGHESDVARACSEHACTDILLADASTRPSTDTNVAPAASTLDWLLPTHTPASVRALRRLGGIDHDVSWDASPHSRQSIVLLI